MHSGLLSVGLALVLTFSIYPAQASDGVTRQSTAPDSGLITWETNNHNVHLRLTQISPDQARAFMQGRGLDEKSVEEFAHTCVYMTVLRNDGKRPITYNLAEWRFVPRSGSAQSMQTKHDWLARWQSRNFSRPVKLAFEWSQFPVEQTFAPGDWNQGMTTFELPPGSSFDVRSYWRQSGRLYEGTLQNVQCPTSFD